MPETRTLHATITLDGKLVDADGDLLQDRYDELHLTVRAQIDGRADAGTLSGKPGPGHLPKSLALRLLSLETKGNECHLRYRLISPKKARPA